MSSTNYASEDQKLNDYQIIARLQSFYEYMLVMQSKIENNEGINAELNKNELIEGILQHFENKFDSIVYFY